MKTTTLTCDFCKKTVDGDGPARRVWASLRLWRQQGMSRVEAKYDICPSCQDAVISNVKAGPGPETRPEPVREWCTATGAMPAAFGANPVEPSQGIGPCDICGHKGAVVPLDFKNHAGGNPATFRHYACRRCMEMP